MKRTFRTALYGFNREDVAAYIERTAAKHKEELAALRAESLPLKKEAERLQAEIAPLQEEIQRLRGENAQLREEMERIHAEPAPAVQAAPASGELEAYRRAEAVERSARQRAESLCSQVGELMDGLSGDMDRSCGELEELIKSVRICIGQINDAFVEFTSFTDSMDFSESGA